MLTALATELSAIIADPARVLTAPAVLDRLSHDFYWYSPILRPQLADKTGDVGVQPVSVEVFQNPMPADRVVLTLTTSPINNTNVFHSEAWIRQRWGRFFDLQFIVARAHAVYQDAAVLTRST